MGLQCQQEIGTSQSRDPVAQRILAILEACGQKQMPVTISFLAQKTELAKSTVHRMCWKLAELGILSQEDGKFTVGTRIAALGSSNAAFQRLRSAAIPYLLELQGVAGASQLAVLTGDRALIVDAIYPSQLPALRLVGASMPLHCTATGKAMLARAEPQASERLLNTIPYVFATSRTIVQVSRLRAELEQIRQSGYALSVEEFQPGITAVAAGFKVGEVAIAAIGTLGRSADTAVRQSAAQVQLAALKLEHALRSEHEESMATSHPRRVLN